MIMVTIKVKQNSKQAKLFLEYVKTLPFVEVLNTSDTSSNKKETLLSDIEKGLQEVKSIREGKTKPLSTSDLWNE
jgi:hypothetical protein